MNGAVPKWLERWLGASPAGSGEGTLWSLDFTWSWAPWMTLAFVILAIVWILYCYASEGQVASRRYKALLVAIRLSLVALAMVMLSELTLNLRRTGLPTVVVMIDDSASMGIGDHYESSQAELAARWIRGAGFDTPTRLNLAKSILLSGDGDLLARLDGRYKLKVYFVSASAALQAGDLSQWRGAVKGLVPQGNATQLGDALRTVLADQRGAPPAAIILFSDGINTSGESLIDAARHAGAIGVPLYAVGLGSEESAPGIELADLVVDDVVFAGDVIDFRFKLIATGLSGREVEITLHEQGQSDNLAKATVVAPEDGRPLAVHLPFAPPAEGDYEFIVEAKPLAEESNTDDNRLERLVSVRKDEIRVLLAEAYPSYEFRYLRNILGRDNTIKLSTVLQDADLEHADQDATALRVFPVRRDEIFQYDVIIFGDVNPANLSPTILANIDDFVEQKGGSVVFIAGQHFTPTAYRDTPLAKLFPIDLSTVSAPPQDQPITEGFQPRPTELGLASPPMQLGDTPADTARVWAALPPLYWLVGATKKPAAQTLAEHPTKVDANGIPLAVISMEYVGAGKTLFHATDETWRWRFRVGDLYFARYWVQTIRFLSRSKLLGKDRATLLTADDRADGVRLRARFFDERLAPAGVDDATVVIERSGQTNRQVTLHRGSAGRGVFEATVGELPPGQYHARLTAPPLEGKAPSVDFRVSPPPGEFERTQMDAHALEQVAQETHGRFYRLSDVRGLAKDLPAGRPVPIESLPPRTLWNEWWLVGTFVGLLVGEWLLRKRKGML